jgi:hypothetical protein
VLGLAITPARLWPGASVGAFAALWLLREAMALKAALTGPPIGYLDVVTNLREPHIVLRALGFHGPLALVVGAFTGVLLVVVAAGLWRFGRPSLRRVAWSAAEIAALGWFGLVSLEAAGRDLRDQLPVMFPDIALDLWESEAHQELHKRTGPLEYIAYTYAAGDRDVLTEATHSASPVPRAEVGQAVERYLRLSPVVTEAFPNIVLFHAESTFDPNAVFRLTRPVDLPLWRPGPDSRSFGPLAVPVVGGGSWVTEFEVLTGVDSRGFGYHGYFTHQTIGMRAQNALPRYLAERGYRTSAYYPETGTFFGVEAAFRRYGFDTFLDQTALRVNAQSTDLEIVRRVLDRGALAPSDGPRFVFISTTENHGPHRCAHFQSRDQLVTSLAGDAEFALDCSLNEFIRRAESTSNAVTLVLAELKALHAATRRPYVLMVYGDHQPWSFTNGTYSVAGGTANAGDMRSFAPFRHGGTERLTFFHVLSSIDGVLPTSFQQHIPATLLPTLLSAYVSSAPDEVYLPVNLLGLWQCGPDLRSGLCPLRHDIEQWTRDFLFRDPDLATTSRRD